MTERGGVLARQRYLADYTVAAMARRRARNLGLLAVYGGMVFVLASVLFYTSALKHEAGLLLAEAPEIVVQRMIAGRHDLIPGGHTAALTGIRGVREVQPRLWGYHYDAAVRANYTLMVPPDRDLEPGTAVIGPALARARGASAGDMLSFRGHDGALTAFRIDAVLPQASTLASADLLLVAEKDFRRLFGIPEDRHTDLALHVPNPREVQTVAEKVLEALPDSRPILRDEILRTYDAVFDWRSALVLLPLSGALLAFAILAWEKASGLSADERREIGILKAIGWETSDVLQMKLWEGALISLLAFLLGTTAAYWHVFGLSAPLLAPVMQGWSVLYPDFRLTPTVSATQLLTLFFLTVFPYLVATLVPVWRAAVTDPDEVMR
ncbi:ABC transporter, permease protein [Thioalkalivibrio nitratireducens DSM 14787]|uniref:ABC transporter, permease protein n=1 Tax=Thioalkalivibrio nitratireducens (strain DSM 14787 / UNIQEM 213 / ALEN2) TaxID=1255043 RepID=L0DV06_THIND|nr:FtsX-like permease family protein [Thioalkalivibrio nitratireducens]AGA32196.1 ABC transporter, permease protein [Thioalkalivibrio nitratireducens DSM 14787]